MFVCDVLLHATDAFGEIESALFKKETPFCFLFALCVKDSFFADSEFLAPVFAHTFVLRYISGSKLDVVLPLSIVGLFLLCFCRTVCNILQNKVFFFFFVIRVVLEKKERYDDTLLSSQTC